MRTQLSFKKMQECSKNKEIYKQTGVHPVVASMAVKALAELTALDKDR